MIYLTLTETMFINEFDAHNRSENFSRKARAELYENFMQMADDSNTPYVLDVIAICCEWVEYESIEDFLADYDTDGYDPEEWLQENTHCLCFDDDCILFANF